LVNIQRLEKSNAENIRSKSDAVTRYNDAIKRLRKPTAVNPKASGAELATGSASGLPVSEQVGGDSAEDVLALGRDAAIRDAEFRNCREFALDALE
jgi:hypothetical protein